ncbi:MAG: alpha/beta hydrolase, partial [Anaerolineae bacterium]|nr:alpha/beta hydrolase [Anaerolineae bacterium]
MMALFEKYEQVDLADLPRFTVEALGIETSYYEVGRPLTPVVSTGSTTATGSTNGLRQAQTSSILKTNGLRRGLRQAQATSQASLPPQKPTVLLLHGMTSSGDAYRELMIALADEYHLIAPDIPGFGFSEMTTPYTLEHLVEWVAAFIDALELGQCLVVGHSFGGVLASHFTMAYPEDVVRLVLIAPALLSAQKVPDLVMKATISLGLVSLGTTISQSRLVVPYQVKSAFYQPEKQPTTVWQRRIRDYDNARATAVVFPALANGSIKNLSKITHPTCLIWGEDDAVVPAA